MPQIGRVLLRVCAAVALVACGVVVADDSPVAAVDGLAVTSATTYRLDPPAGVVHATTTLGFTNTTVDVEDAGVVQRRYFSAFTFPVPVGAGDPVATTADGTSLDVTSDLIAGNSSFFTYTVHFAAPLYSAEHLDITVSYDISGLPPRSTDPSRVNPAYAAFTAYGVGDPGQASIRVEVPAGYDIDTIGSDAQVTTADGVTVYTADAIAQPDQYALFVSARADEALVSAPVATSDGARFDVRSWPGDTEWQQFVADRITADVPQLESLVGAPWPVDATVTVREAFTPYLYGYAGWFSVGDDELEIGEDLDPQVVLHELSHAWFNTAWFDDRWVNEGLAQTYAAAALTASGGSPTPATPPAADDPDRISLLEWGQPDLVQGADGIESYGYAASYAVIQQIVDHLGLDGMGEVLAAVDADTIAYVAHGPAEADATATTDWRRLLDLVDEVARVGSGDGWTAQPLFEQYVVTTDVLPELQARAEARAAYAALVERGGDWAPPLAVRRAMADWSFDEAQTAIVGAEAALVKRDTLAAAAAQLGLTPGGDDRTAYETADDLGVVDDHLDARIAVVTLVQRATDLAAADPGLLERVGSWGDDPAADVAADRAALTAGDDDTARESAQRAIDTYDGATTNGVRRVSAVGAGVAVLSLVVGATLRRRRHHDHDHPGQAAET